jgi:hypothetical protein
VHRASFVALAAATLAASAEWVIAHTLRVDFTLTADGGSLVLGLPSVIIVTAWFAGTGWAALAVVERCTQRALTIWTWLAAGILLLSFVPLFVEHATAGTCAVPATVHITVASTLIYLMHRTRQPWHSRFVAHSRTRRMRIRLTPAR